jgi:hypothetical protein
LLPLLWHCDSNIKWSIYLRVYWTLNIKQRPVIKFFFRYVKRNHLGSCNKTIKTPFPSEHWCLEFGSNFLFPFGLKSWLMFRAWPSSWAQTRAVKSTVWRQSTIEDRSLKMRDLLAKKPEKLGRIVIWTWTIETYLGRMFGWWNADNQRFFLQRMF